MKINDKLDNLNLNKLEIKNLLKISKGIRDTINVRIEESNLKPYGLCLLLYRTIPKYHWRTFSYINHFEELLPDEKYDIDGNLLKNGLYRFAIDHSEEDPIKAFYKYRLIWLEELITLLETKLITK